jgi:hypothetical protein
LIRASSFSYLARRLHPSFKRLALNTGPAIHDPYYVFCVSRSPHPPSRDPSSPHTHTRARARSKPTRNQTWLLTWLLTWQTYLANLPGKLTWQTYLANLPGKLTGQTDLTTPRTCTRYRSLSRVSLSYVAHYRQANYRARRDRPILFCAIRLANCFLKSFQGPSYSTHVLYIYINTSNIYLFTFIA